jgi:hypothetical protein
LLAYVSFTTCPETILSTYVSFTTVLKQYCWLMSTSPHVLKQ